jgi:hypothetical protein
MMRHATTDREGRNLMYIIDIKYVSCAVGSFGQNVRRECRLASSRMPKDTIGEIHLRVNEWPTRSSSASPWFKSVSSNPDLNPDFTADGISVLGA